MKTAIIIGHTKLRPGAYSPYLNINEWTLNKRIAECLSDLATIYTYDSYHLGYTRMVKRMASRINTKNYDLVLELHFNAADSPKANGCEALYYFKNQSARDLGEYFCELMEVRMGIKNRFSKPLYSKKQRGFAALYYPEPTTLILEPFFGTNAKDCARFSEVNYIEIIRELIKVYRHDY